MTKKIKALELGITPINYSNAQVQERLELFTRLCYELISDFREVEDNFKQIHRSIVEHHTKAEQNKGAIIGFAFEAYDALRTSSQGKSFYAFWDFLISRAGQEDWRQLTEQLISLLEDREIETDKTFIQNIKSFLLEQGKSVYNANDKMAEKTQPYYFRKRNRPPSPLCGSKSVALKNLFLNCWMKTMLRVALR